MNNTVMVPFHRLVAGNQVYDDELHIAPWEIEIGDFAMIDDEKVIRQSLNVIKNEHVMLVLSSSSGKRYGNTILINFDSENLSIDRPIDFDQETVNSFRIYFRDINEVWSFFEVEVVSDCPYSLCATYPKVLYRLQRLRRQRIDVPENTRAVFWQGDVIHNGGEVRNISSAGMLLCTEAKEEKFAENTNIHDIAIALPLHESPLGSDEENSTVLPVITGGRIVRSFCEEGTGKICLGVSFSDENNVIAEIEAFVKETMTYKDDKE